MTPRSKILIPAAIVIVGLALMILFLNLRGGTSKRGIRMQTKIVDTEIVRLGDVPTNIVGYGRVVSSQPIELYSEVAGILEKGDIPFKPAQSFKKGELIVKIDDRQARLSLNSTKSDLLNALASVLPEIKVDFPDEYQVWQEYFNDCNFDSELKDLPETENQKIRMYLSRYNVYKLYFSARDLEIKLSKHYFYAPFDGTIVSTGLRVGATARSGSLLGEIINLEELEVEVPVSTEDIRWIDKKAPVLFTSAEIDGRWTGRVSRVGDAIDDRTQTIPVYVAMDNHRKVPVYEGMFFKAEIPGDDIPDAFLLPRRALYSDQYVYLIKDGKLKYQMVDVNRLENSSVIISEGLHEGDTIVTEALQGVFDGMPAESKMMPIESEAADE